MSLPLPGYPGSSQFGVGLTHIQHPRLLAWASFFLAPNFYYLINKGCRILAHFSSRIKHEEVQGTNSWGAICDPLPPAIPIIPGRAIPRPNSEDWRELSCARVRPRNLLRCSLGNSVNRPVTQPEPYKLRTCVSMGVSLAITQTTAAPSTPFRTLPSPV